MLSDFEKLKSERITAIVGLETESECVLIETENFRMVLYHEQDCCEEVRVEDVTGDPSDLIGGVVVIADESTSEKGTDWGHETWTFYRICTDKGDVTIRWLGESNGYYGEEVDVVIVGPEWKYGEVR